MVRKRIGLCMDSGTLRSWFLGCRWPRGGPRAGTNLGGLGRSDRCDGSYRSYCGMTPKLDNITEILRHYGQDELLVNMDRFWVAAL